MRVISLFDGLAGARVALRNLGLDDQNIDYYASEIDKAAIAIAKHHFPTIHFVGDVTELKVGPKCPKNADLLIGGSPCQDLSVAGPKTGLQGTRSSLLYEYIRILQDVQPKYFVLENVASMKKVHQAEITKLLGVEPVLLNSADFTPQNRKRLFWTNIDVPEPLHDTTLSRTVRNIWLHNEPYEYAYGFMVPWGGKINKQGFYNVGIIPESLKPKGNYFPRERVFHIDGKARALTTVYSQTPWYTDGYGIRKLMAEEAELLQGLPANYTNIMWKKKFLSRAKRFHAIGNGFTIPVIEHILKKII